MRVLILEKLHEDSLEDQLEPLFACFRDYRNEGESFGDFCCRYTFEGLRQFSETYVPPQPTGSGRRRNRVGVSDELFGQAKGQKQVQQAKKYGRCIGRGDLKTH